MIKSKRNKNMKVIKTLWDCFVVCVKNIKIEIIEELSKIAVLFEILIPVFLMYINKGIPETIVLSCFFVAFERYLKEVSNSLNKKDQNGIPVPLERYTRKDKDGFIELTNEEDYYEMLQYVYEVETYMEKKGLIK